MKALMTLSLLTLSLTSFDAFSASKGELQVLADHFTGVKRSTKISCKKVNPETIKELFIKSVEGKRCNISIAAQKEIDTMETNLNGLTSAKREIRYMESLIISANGERQFALSLKYDTNRFKVCNLPSGESVAVAAHGNKVVTIELDQNGENAVGINTYEPKSYFYDYNIKIKLAKTCKASN